MIDLAVLPGRGHGFRRPVHGGGCVWSDPGNDVANIAWVRDGWTASERFGHHGRIYLNFPGHGEDGAALTRTSFGSNYRRLVDTKTKYDPENRFRFNQNIAPGG